MPKMEIPPLISIWKKKKIKNCNRKNPHSKSRTVVNLITNKTLSNKKKHLKTIYLPKMLLLSPNNRKRKRKNLKEKILKKIDLIELTN